MKTTKLKRGFKALALLSLIFAFVVGCNKQQTPTITNPKAKVTSSNFISKEAANTQLNAYGSIEGFSFDIEDLRTASNEFPQTKKATFLKGINTSGQLTWIMVCSDSTDTILGSFFLNHSIGCPTQCPITVNGQIP